MNRKLTRTLERLRTLAVIGIAFLTAGFVLRDAALGASPREPVDFAREVWPLLARHCVECHGAKRQEAGLRLDGSDHLGRGGENGPVVRPGKAAESELLRRVSLPGDDAEVMPPRGKRLTPEQQEIVRRWIDQGAQGTAAGDLPPHWSYQPPKRPHIPVRAGEVENASFELATRERQDAFVARGPIDALVRRRQKAAGLEPSAPADRAVLFRRLSLDLIGIPPTPEQVDAFLDETGPDAWERGVDRLLASDQLGVRWARPWLDYGRYADSHGFQRDDFRDLWAYRDWVVDALNADLPYDQFTIEQLAGDLLPRATRSQQIATGFNRAAPCNVEAGSDPEETRVNQVHDRVHTLGAVWLGATLECCQCHDHKYDPLSMRDYYGLFAIFNNTVIEAERSNPRVPGSIRFLGAALNLAPTTESEPAETTEPAAPAAKKPADKKAAAKKTAAKKTAAQSTTQVMRELEKPRSTTLFLRGDFRTPGEPVTASLPLVLTPGERPESAGSSTESSANRLALARWLMRDDHPRTARVAVNRLWGELMGRPLVATPEDFGIKGEPPTHPELLDWLACEFRDRAWSTKRLIREIVTSTTYRQTSNATSDARERDDQNLWLGRAGRWRLDAEAIRDNALAISGLLSRQRGGPPIRPHQPDGLWVKVGGERYDYVLSPPGERHRRGLYVVWKRAAPYPSFMNFDATNRMACRVSRSRTNTPLQALTLLNDPVYVEAAMALAERLSGGESNDGATSGDGAASGGESDSKPVDRSRLAEDAWIDRQITWGWRLSVARIPSADEVATLRALYDQQLAASRMDPRGTAEVWGERTIPAGKSREEMSAWLAVATALLNLDETMTRR